MDLKDFVSSYAAVISTLLACKWFFEQRPYYVISLHEPPRGGCFSVSVHNPGRKTIFIVGTKIIFKDKQTVNHLVKCIPEGPGRRGYSPEYAGQLMVGHFFMSIKSEGFEHVSISSIHDKTNVSIAFLWHRGHISHPKIWKAWQRLTNPLQVRVTNDIVQLLMRSDVN